MTPIRTPNCNVTFVAPGCEDLPAFQGDGMIVTYWKPKPEDLALLNAGFPVKFSLVADRPPPMAVEVETL